MDRAKRRKTESDTAEDDQLREVNEFNKDEVLRTFDQINYDFEILGRSTEMNTLQSFFSDCIQNEKGNAIYLSGNPGTGKTLCMKKVLNQLRDLVPSKEFTYDVIWLNAMICITRDTIYEILASKLTTEFIPSKDVKEWVFNYFTVEHKRNHFYILCIDEIDNLLHFRDSEDLYRFFELPFISVSHLILVGISNTVDLIETNLPLLKTKNLYQPKTVVFKSYSKDDLLNIIQQRIELSSSSLPPDYQLFTPQALQLCCRKVEQYGDARKALDICKEALKASFTQVPPSPVSIRDMSKVLTKFFGSSSEELLLELPTRTQELLCVVTMLQMISDEAPASRLKKKPITVSVIKSNYKKLLSTYIAVGRPSMSEFNSLLDQLVFNGIIKRQSSKKSKDLDQISLLIDKNDIIDLYQSNPQLNLIFQKKKIFSI